MKISVIIPTYNVERYLSTCIEGITNQSYKNIEIILVDDGSNDTSGEICDRYAQKDDRILVIHKKNGGLSDARNVGIKKASGEYIVFVDSDDFLCDKHFFSEVVKRIQLTKPDVLNYVYVKYFNEGKRIVPYIGYKADLPIDKKSLKAQLKYIFDEGLYIASACNKIVRKDILSDYMLFKKGKFS